MRHVGANFKMKKTIIVPFFIFIHCQLLAQGLMESTLIRANENIDKGNYALASISIDEVLKIDPDNFDAKYLKAKILRIQGSPAESVKILDHLIDMLPVSDDLFYERGLANLDLKNFGLAIKDFTKAIEIDPTFSGYYIQRGYAFYSLEDHNKAEVDLSYAIEINPDFPHTYNIRGYNRIALEEDKKAVEDFTKSLELDPEFHDSYYGRGLAYYNLYEDEKACEDFKIAYAKGLDYAEEYIKGCE